MSWLRELWRRVAGRVRARERDPDLAAVRREQDEIERRLRALGVIAEVRGGRGE